MTKLNLRDELLAKIDQKTQDTKQHATNVFNIELGGIELYFDKKLEKIDINHIVPNPRNARIEFNQEAMDLLAKSIESEGLLNPITVRKMGLNKYQIVAGERRYRACVQLGFEEVECIVVTLTDEKMDFLMLTENLVREKISTYEIAKGVIEFEKNYPSKKEFAELLGISRQKLYKLLSYKKLPAAVLDVLSRSPSLLPDYAADQIATLENKGYSMQQMEPIILDALNKVAGGEIEPSGVGVYVKNTLKTKDKTKNNKPAVIKEDLSDGDGKKYGSFKKTPKGITITLDSLYLNEEVEENIKAYLKQTIITNECPKLDTE